MKCGWYVILSLAQLANAVCNFCGDGEQMGSGLNILVHNYSEAFKHIIVQHSSAISSKECGVLNVSNSVVQSVFILGLLEVGLHPKYLRVTLLSCECLSHCYTTFRSV